MDSTSIFFISLISVIVWSAILNSIISSASRSHSIREQLKIQTLLLAKMAQKAGVSDVEVNNIINKK